MKRGLVIALALAILGAGAGLLIAARVSAKVRAERLQQAISSAEKWLEDGESAKAAETLKPWRGQSLRGDLGERLLALDMKALDASGDNLTALAAARRYAGTFPKGPERAEAEFILLKPMIATDASDPEVRGTIEKFMTDYPDHPAGVRLKMALAKADMKAGKTEEAQKSLLALWEANPPESEKQALADLLGEVNMAVLMTPTPQAGETVIELKEGQYLYNIAREHKVPLDLLLAVNQIKDPKRLRIGQKIRIPEVQISLVCDKAENTLTVYNHGQFFIEYPVRTGRRAEETPTGEFKIQNKKADPTWKSPIDGKTYKAGDPKNELGSRWMSFEGDVLGIHGTIHPETVGHYASNGCIGMLKEDVEELFTYVSVGTPLRIVGKQDLAKHRVIEDEESKSVASSE